MQDTRIRPKWRRFWSRFIGRFFCLFVPALLALLVGIVNQYFLVIGFGLLFLDGILSLQIPYKLVTALLIGLLTVSCGFAAFTMYWSTWHGFVSHVDAIIAYPYEQDEDCYRFEIQGTIQSWFYDSQIYENVTLSGRESGGETRYWNTGSRSNVLTISRTKSEFLIILDVDTSSYNWGPDIDDYIFDWRFFIEGQDNHGKYALFMNDFRNVHISWQEPQKVTDPLLNDGGAR